MASNSAFELFNTGIINNNLSQTADGAQGISGNIMGDSFKTKTFLNESFNDTGASILDTHSPLSIKKGISCLEAFSRCLVGPEAFMKGINMVYCQSTADLAKQKIGISFGSRD